MKTINKKREESTYAYCVKYVKYKDKKEIKTEFIVKLNSKDYYSFITRQWFKGNYTAEEFLTLFKNFSIKYYNSKETYKKYPEII